MHVFAQITTQLRMLQHAGTHTLAKHAFTLCDSELAHLRIQAAYSYSSAVSANLNLAIDSLA